MTTVESTGETGKVSLLQGGLFLLALLPGLYLLHLVRTYGVNVPYADEFTLAPLLVEAHNHTLTLADLFAQHNQHRLFFPRLVFIAFARFAQGNLRDEMVFSVVLAGLTAINLWIVQRRTIPVSRAQALFLCLLFNLLLFSPIQSENWTWGLQSLLLLCNYLFSCGIVIATAKINLPLKYAASLILALLGTFSFGGGALLWALGFPLALALEEKIFSRRSMAWLVAWILPGIATLALYFRGLRRPEQIPIATGMHVLDYFSYVAMFLGSHLATSDRCEFFPHAWTIGAILLSLFLSATIYGFMRGWTTPLFRRMLPWIAIGLYASVNACIAAKARISLGVNQALDSRYTSFSLYLSVSLIGLLVLALQDLRSRSLTERRKIYLARFDAALLIAFFVFWIETFSWGRNAIAKSEGPRRRGKGALLFANVLDSGAIYDRCLIANAYDARRFANMEDAIGLIHPAMFKTADLSKLPTSSKKTGFLDEIRVTGTACEVIGWAVRPRLDGIADCVVLSYEKEGGVATAFWVADESYDRVDVATKFKSDRLTNSGWRAHFDRSILPPGGRFLIRAWLLETNKGILYPLDTPKILP